MQVKIEERPLRASDKLEKNMKKIKNKMQVKIEERPLRASDWVGMEADVSASGVLFSLGFRV